MATRMQQRRGTAAQWTSTNAGLGPVLNAGEIGWESDTNRFKIGDGVNNWANLDYFADINSTINPAFGSSITFEGATADSYETVLQVTDPTADRTITFPDATGTVVLADGSGNVTVSGDLTVSGTTTTINSTTINATTGIVFEGTTANSFETTLAVTDPTEDRTITLPNVTGTVITTGNLSDITDIGVFTSTITMEGSTADAHELTLSAGDPTADRTITFPDASGTVALAEDVSTSLGSYIESADIGAISGVAGLDSSKNLLVPGTKIIFEGSDDNYETEFVVTDPTSDVVLTFPNATGTIALTSDISVSASSTNTFSNKSISFTSNPVTGTLAEFNTALSDADFATIAGTETLTNKTLTTPTINGPTITATGQTPTIHGIYLPATHNIIFEGETANDFETTLYVADPTGDRTITLPDATGTVQLRVTDVSDTEIGYLNGVTSAIQTQMDAKAPTANASFTGTFSAPSGTITSTMIADGTIVDADINSAAAIAQSKIDGLSTSLSAKADLAGATFTGAIAMGTNKITGLGTPTDSADAATKAYVDAVTEGLHIHPSVVAATTANVTLASALENGDTLDGVTLATGNRILVKNQTTQSENGIYVVAASGAPSRATDFDSPAEIDGGDFVFVTGGTANDNTGWVQINTVGTVGTDAIAFTQFSGAGTYTAGNGLTLNGSVFTIDTTITQARVADVSDTEIGYLNGVTSAIQTQLDGKVDESLLDAKGDLLVASADNTPAKLSVGTNGYILTANSSATNGIEWAVAPAGYSAPTLGSTSIASGATVTSIAGLTLSSPTISGSLTAGGGTGTNGQVLQSTGSGIQWGTVSGYSAPTLGSTSIASGATVTTIAGLTLTNPVLDEPILVSPEERWTVSATAATGTIAFDAKTSGVLYYTSNASANWTLNVRGDGSNTLNNMLTTGDSITVSFFATNGATPYYQTGFQIDGSAVTPKWINGTVPTFGNASSIDVYTFTIVKTANATFTVFASQTKFA